MATWNNDNVEIREVWKSNFAQEIENMRLIIQTHRFMSLDTEFPENIHGDSSTYQTMRANVSSLKIIQLGLAFSDYYGNLPLDGIFPHRGVVWQVNFSDFDPSTDPHNRDSIEVLRMSGINFQKNREEGVSISEFRAHFVPSGIIQNRSLCYIAFHGSSDYAYLVKMFSVGK
ncbi:probable CCR4-associated factor 1 homolog 11 [Neltuma alba]|uniref:probable CCR4-associated factor 1 homolog 11 n=1 Tax=Neltuma alba TaxID=207710 RepID=UPI0010A321C1|nr:probable CCR4-associated factor 1 homolog 11 [Prosopis alba]